MENFEKILKRKKEIDYLYKKELSGIGDIKFQKMIKNQIQIAGFLHFEQEK